MLNLVRTQKENLDDVIIGSRFVEDGGYKGVKDLSKNKFIQAIRADLKALLDLILFLVVE